MAKRSEWTNICVAWPFQPRIRTGDFSVEWHVHAEACDHLSANMIAIYAARNQADVEDGLTQHVSAVPGMVVVADCVVWNAVTR